MFNYQIQGSVCSGVVIGLPVTMRNKLETTKKPNNLPSVIMFTREIWKHEILYVSLVKRELLAKTFRPQEWHSSPRNINKYRNIIRPHEGISFRASNLQKLWRSLRKNWNTTRIKISTMFKCSQSPDIETKNRPEDTTRVKRNCVLSTRVTFFELVDSGK